MKKIFALNILLTVCVTLFAQKSDYSIEYENCQVGVFNPQWETSHTLNPNKYEHITGYFREELAKTILDAVKSKRIRIYDIRKRELNLDTVINRIILFEQQQGTTLTKQNALDYIIPYISAYDFEEAVTYRFSSLSIEKKVLAYCPYIVHYKSFAEDENDTVRMPLFWIFPKDSTVENFVLQNKNAKPSDKTKQTLVSDTVLHIPDTVLSVLKLKYPVKMPFTSNIVEQTQSKQLHVYRSDGSEFKSSREIDGLFVLKRTILVYNDMTGTDTLIDTYSDIIAEDISAVRVAENWQINPVNLEIIKKVQYFLPLYDYDDQTYAQIGFRIINKKQ
ncbi:MAG: hypothetical protein J6M30_08385 [Bacteroidales bacterium]|nr:hypothetical protein [Bacteroidales bacterium]